ncbi:ankyrin [Lophiostoma macrostomum CBS 122681]|uniref:Ankyrin n=1 Tax=Lophiostoma macrostomum CBS 122681 TaxID=1314788 RepID=A0A6A6T4U1_9PLEO|nr:ankyrin [Lophiostoma macrostomum CBS 122681]
MQQRQQAELEDEYKNAIDQHDSDLVKKIIESRANNDRNYIPPLSAIMVRATMQDQPDIVSWCIDQADRAGLTVIHPRELMKTVVATEPGALKTHKMLVEKNLVDLDYYVPWFGTAFSVAATSGAYEWAKWCLEKGVDPNIDRVDEYKTVIAGTAENGHIDMVKLLLEHGAELNGSGAIVLAAEAGEKDMVDFLLKQGASINEIGVECPVDERITEDAGSALHMAAEGGHKDVVELLVDKGAIIDIEDVKGRTPLSRARAAGHGEIVEYLGSRGAR